MRVASGKVVHGQIDNEEGFVVGPELKAVLLQAIAECDRGDRISADQLLRELQSDE
jgi:hypothetical protein